MPPAKSIAASRTKGYLAVLITCTFAWTICYLYMFQMREFGIGLFIWLPFVMGVLCTMIHRWNNPGRNVDTVYYLLFALLIFYGGLILFAWDGVICDLTGRNHLVQHPHKAGILLESLERLHRS